ncbi:Cbp1 family collagen-binding glycoprotein adhesin [Sunxiuqinia sp. A32]|uniref:Cbp1 family collagen-binding glycoprotein adhesin n=1 Tax=Sunxiuqinia sp. A32 TaxID=3461496 RepID=UPI004045916C
MNYNKKTLLTTILIALAIIITGVGASVYFYNQKVTEVSTLQSENENINQVLSERDSVVNELVDAFNQIEQNLKFIKEKRKQLSIDTETEGGKDQKQAILADISLMNEMLEESSKHIADLEKNLKNSGFQLNSFKKKIANLTKSIEDQNMQIAELKKDVEERDFMIADLNKKVDEMEFEIAKKSDTLEMKQEVINQKTNELNKAYIAYGTYKELKERGLLTKDGGFLWIGRHTAIEENFDGDYFTELNIQDTKTIPLHSKKATIISEHPDSSYSLVEEDGMVSYLQIENPEEFWKISKYAVIEVK